MPSSESEYERELLKGQQESIDFLLTVPVGKLDPVKDLERWEQLEKTRLAIDEFEQRKALFKQKMVEEKIQYDMAELKKKIKHINQKQRDLELEKIGLSRELELLRAQLSKK